MVFFAFCLASLGLKAQVDTILTISEVEIRADGIRESSSGSHVQSFDNQTLERSATQNVAELLTQNTGIFLKTYGLGILATVSTRGTGANHTAVLWNGFNLQSSMNGTVDFSLLPVFLLNAVEVQYGGGSARDGSGALGGTIRLKNQLELGKGLSGSFGSSVGSFADFEQFGKLSFSNRRVGSSVKIIHHSAENDFSLSNGFNPKQTNSAFDQFAILQDNVLKINERQVLKTFFWYENTDREIPPSRTESTSDARQLDKSYRVGAEWSRLGGKGASKVRTAYLEDDLFFSSVLVDSSRSQARTFISEAEQLFYFKKNQSLKLKIHDTYNFAKAAELGSTHSRNRLALLASYEFFFLKNRLDWQTDIRQEWVNGESIPFTASTGSSFKINDLWTLKGKVSKNFNLPNFNDLYFRDATALGNPDLLSESGWSEEAGVHFRKKFKRMQIHSELTVFTSKIKNWIQWLPNGPVWRPENKKSVWARGLESSVKVDYRADNWGFSGKILYHFTRSTVEEIRDDEDPELLGKQLIYVPLHTANAYFSISYKNTFFSYNHHLTGKRYPTTDNRQEDALAAFQLGDISFGQSFEFQGWAASLNLKLQNIWNESYEVLAARPMPLRNYQLEFRVNF